MGFATRKLPELSGCNKEVLGRWLTYTVTAIRCMLCSTFESTGPSS